MTCLMCKIPPEESEEGVEYIEISELDEDICKPCLGLLRSWKVDRSMMLLVDDRFGDGTKIRIKSEFAEFLDSLGFEMTEPETINAGSINGEYVE